MKKSARAAACVVAALLGLCLMAACARALADTAVLTDKVGAWIRITDEPCQLERVPIAQRDSWHEARTGGGGEAEMVACWAPIAGGRVFVLRSDGSGAAVPGVLFKLSEPEGAAGRFTT